MSDEMQRAVEAALVAVHADGANIQSARHFLRHLASSGFHVHPLPPEGVISCCDHNGNVVEAEVTNRPQSRMAKAAEVMASGGMSLLMAPPELRYRIPFDRPKIVESSAPNEATDTGSVKSSESLDRPEPETSDG